MCIHSVLVALPFGGSLALSAAQDSVRLTASIISACGLTARDLKQADFSMQDGDPPRIATFVSPQTRVVALTGEATEYSTRIDIALIEARRLRW
jgi:hypothetical protein